MSRFSRAKTRVLDDLESLIEQLLRANRKHKHGALWNVVNPYRPKAKAEQMCVWLRGTRRGAWRDFVSGECGDAIDLIAFVLAGAVTPDSRMGAVAWVEDRYGLRDMDPATRERMDTEAKSRRIAAEANEQRRRKASIDRARKFFFACSPDVTGTPVDTYLQSRNIVLGQIPNLGRSLRYRPDCAYWMEDGKPRIPAMIAAMVDAQGHIGACHYTFLRQDGSGKADVGRSKMMFPDTAGLMIRLTNGESGLSAEDAAKQGVRGPLAVLEGNEDGLSVAMANPELRIWGAGSLSGYLTIPDHACISSFLLFQDNDWGKPQAKKQFDAAVARLKMFRKPVEVIAMPADWGKDVNDAIRSDD